VEKISVFSNILKTLCTEYYYTFVCLFMEEQPPAGQDILIL